MSDCIEQAPDDELREELEARGYWVVDKNHDMPKAAIDLLKGQRYVVLEEGLPSHVALHKYFGYTEPLADQPALDLWTAAAQGESR